MEKMQEKKRYGILDWVERVGNKIPHPFMLFFFLSVFIIFLSWGLNSLDVQVIDPVKNEVVKVKNLLSSEGINFMLQNTIKNFTGFSPLGLVLVMTLGIGLAEHVGSVSVFMRNTILNSSPKVITFMIMLIGICGNIALDGTFSHAYFLSLSFFHCSPKISLL